MKKNRRAAKSKVPKNVLQNILAEAGGETGEWNGGTGTDEQGLREVVQSWYAEFAAAGLWHLAAEVAELATHYLPTESFGWERFAWALHQQGHTWPAYHLLTAFVSKSSGPSPRSAYYLACFCATLEKKEEAGEWVKIAYTAAADKQVFLSECLRELSLRAFWPELLDFALAVTRKS